MDRGGDRSQTNRTATELLNDCKQEFAIHLVEAVSIDFHPVQGIIGYVFGDATVVVNLCVIAYPSQQAIDDTRSAPRSLRDFARAFVVDFHPQDLRRAPANYFQILMRIKVQVKDYSKTAAQWRCDQTRSCRRPYQGELRQIQLDRA